MRIDLRKQPQGLELPLPYHLCSQLGLLQHEDTAAFVLDLKDASDAVVGKGPMPHVLATDARLKPDQGTLNGVNTLFGA